MRWWIGLLVAILLAGCAKKETASPERALYEQAKERLSAGDYDEANRLLKQFIDQSPHLLTALRDSYLAYTRTPNYPPQHAYELLVAYEPRSKEFTVEVDRASYYQVLGTLAFLSGKNREADRWFRIAVETDPQNHIALNDYAYMLAEEGRDLERALKMAQKAVAIKSGQGAYYDTLGWVLYKLGRYEEALRELRIAVQTAPETAELRYHLAATYAKLGRTQDALVELEKSLALKPNYEPAYQLQQTLKGKR
ncbi:MAG: tetratricopeptide repeat protein [Fimbriimonadales bacterium]